MTVGSVLTIVLLHILLRSGRTSLLLVPDLAQGTAAKIEGQAWLSQITGRDPDARSDEPDATETSYQYAIGDLKFDVPYDACAALDERAQYRVYYAPRSKVLLSIEPL